MRTLLATIVSTLVLVEATAQVDYPSKTRFITSLYKGVIYESCITAEMFDKIPVWDPLSQKPIPISPEQAIQMARSVLEKHVPERDRANWTLARVDLQHYDLVYPPKAYFEAGQQKWYYVVHFWNKSNPEVAAFPTPAAIRAKQEEFNIFVLLSGEACNPIPRGKQNDSEPSAPANGASPRR